MKQYVSDRLEVFKRYKPLLINLVRRDIKVKYRRSVLGILWSVLNPLLMMVIMTLVFQNIFRMGGTGVKLVAKTGMVPNFSVYLIAGQVVFNFFSEATSTAMTSVFGNAALIKKVYIPKYIFPLEKVAFSLVNTMFSLIAMAIVLVATGSSISWWILMAPVALALCFFFNLGVGMILSAGVVFFRDIQHLYGVLMLALTYFTPIFYDPNVMFGPGSFMHKLIKFNPLYWYVGLFRQFVVYGEAPTIYQWSITVSCSFVAFVLGLFVFKKTQDKYILYI